VCQNEWYLYYSDEEDCVLAPTNEFATMSQRAQIAALRPIAVQAIRAFGVNPATLRCINHGFNTTYAVIDATGAKYALRLNTHSLRDRAGLYAEQQWIRELAKTTDVIVPTPLYTDSGAPFVELPFAPMQKTLVATMAHWLPGRIVGARPSRQQVRHIGATMAHLHRHSAQWRPTDDAQFPLVNQPLMNSDDHLSGAAAHRISADVRSLIAAVRPQVAQVYAELNAHTSVQPIHGDMHVYNVMWHNNRLAVFDFDDAGLGLPIQDLAITLYYIRDIPYAEAELWAGYHSVNRQLTVAPDALETLLIGRGILLLNDLLVLTNPAESEFVPEYLRRMRLRLQHFVDTGRFALLK
jgi:Ser/Thr protein kinase RdoA (MazF antagonist)